MTPQAKRSIALARVVTQHRGHEVVTTSDLLVAMVADPQLLAMAEPQIGREQITGAQMIEEREAERAAGTDAATRPGYVQPPRPRGAADGPGIAALALAEVGVTGRRLSRWRHEVSRRTSRRPSRAVAG